MLSEADVSHRLRMMGAPTFGSLQFKVERLARLEHYAFKRLINEQIALGGQSIGPVKTDFNGAGQFVSVPDTSNHGHPSLH